MAAIDKMARIVERLLGPLRRRVLLMITRGVVRLVDDSLKAQGLQVEAYQTGDDIERFQDYGITSVPFADGNAEALCLAISGNTAHLVVPCVMDRTRRPTDLVEGDVCLYTDKGERVYLDRVADIVHLGAKSGAEFVALADKIDTQLNALKDAIDNAVPIAQDGGVGFQTTLMAGLAAWPGSVAATKVKAI